MENIKKSFLEKKLKITPQRMVIFRAVLDLKNHPTADNIIEYIRKDHSNIAVGTVYKVLDTLVENGLIRRVKTDKDIMRYDGKIDNHHHLYCTTCDLIEDYQDIELDKLLKNYFKDKKINGFEIEDFVLQIRGTFDKC